MPMSAFATAQAPATRETATAVAAPLPSKPLDYALLCLADELGLAAGFEGRRALTRNQLFVCSGCGRSKSGYGPSLPLPETPTLPANRGVRFGFDPGHEQFGSVPGWALNLMVLDTTTRRDAITTQKKLIIVALADLCAVDMRPFHIVKDSGFMNYTETFLNIGVNSKVNMRVDNILPYPTTIKRNVQT
ncbi:hypothetical protein AXG93_1660s1260 [Marchantia polymorpha subsp. ruderalis]|uniref:Hermes trasposase DNA-binding domain-containing protein n=1 Tax=Marchantia polymorpha subsp. ruderalis TaxID=1480154 RepID=A0A176VRQ8_MARPO|nr:hypothetical protein AXG93_1660s1260 [Marchantia polymorpha subsp. ruderalis]